MSKTYRALAIVAVVAPLVSVVSQLWVSGTTVAGWYAPVGVGTFLSGLLPEILLPTITLAAPVVSTFAIVVAAQARRWGWLVVFVLLGLFAVYVPTMLYFLEPYFGLARPLRAAGLDALAPELLPLVVLTIATLIFVASARPRQSVAGVERRALQPR